LIAIGKLQSSFTISTLLGEKGETNENEPQAKFEGVGLHSVGRMFRSGSTTAGCGNRLEGNLSSSGSWRLEYNKK